MRTFIAVPLPSDCLAMLSEIQARLRSFNADVRWVSTPAIHLTLKFLGEIDPAMVPELARSLRDASRDERPLTLTMRGLGGFPNIRNPRVLWCGLEGDIERLGGLQKKVEEACIPLGFEPEGRGFHAHLTLGRVQGEKNLQSLLDYIRIADRPGCSFTAGEYRIYKSVLSPRGATYTVLETIPLAG